MPTEPTLAPYYHRQVPTYDHEYCTAPIRTCQDNTTLHRNPTSVFPTHPPLHTLHDIPPTEGGPYRPQGRGLVRGDHIWICKENRRAARSERGDRTSFSKASLSGEDCSVAGEQRLGYALGPTSQWPNN